MNNEQVDKILNTIGLKRTIVAKEPEFYVCDKTQFVSYVSKEYQNSELQKTDEVYRMHEQILLHNETGLRFRYSTYENYVGDEVEYKFIEMFVLNIKNQRIEIIEVNMEKRMVVSKEGVFLFDELSKSKY